MINRNNYISLKNVAKSGRRTILLPVRDLRPTLTKEVGIEADSPPKKYSKTELKVRI